MRRALSIVIPALVAVTAVGCASADGDAQNGEGQNDEGSAALSKGRAARIIGARGLDWAAANGALGPLDDQRIFYPNALPSSFVGTEGDKLPAGVTAVISYRQENTNVLTFINSIPSTRRVIMTYHHEPEGDYGSAGSRFVSEFVSQSKLIRSVGKTNVRMAMVAGSYQYGNSNLAGASCSYIPPASSVDMYTLDYYEPTPSGAGQGLAKSAKWNGWLNCTQGKGRPLGLTEYGLGTGAGNAVRLATLKADNAYLKATFTNFQIWSYWWVDDSVSEGPLKNYKFTDSATIAEWKAIESGS